MRSATAATTAAGFRAFVKQVLVPALRPRGPGTIVPGHDCRCDDRDRELPAVLDSVPAQDARGWFKHCGYALD